MVMFGFLLRRVWRHPAAVSRKNDRPHVSVANRPNEKIIEHSFRLRTTRKCPRCTEKTKDVPSRGEFSDSRSPRLDQS